MFTLKIETENAAFEDDMRGEIARILIEIADTLNSTDEARGPTIDLNGNTVGQWKVFG